MPRNRSPIGRPRTEAVAPPSYAVIATALLIMLGLALLIVRSGAIETLNTSGLFGS
jgi:hypothetical protein